MWVERWLSVWCGDLTSSKQITLLKNPDNPDKELSFFSQACSAVQYENNLFFQALALASHLKNRSISAVERRSGAVWSMRCHLLLGIDPSSSTLPCQVPFEELGDEGDPRPGSPGRAVGGPHCRELHANSVVSHESEHTLGLAVPDTTEPLGAFSRGGLFCGNYQGHFRGHENQGSLFLARFVS